jgi:hypothetical protein
MIEKLKAWWETKLVEGERIFKSYSTYVVLAYSMVPQAWAALPDDAKEQVYATLPWVRGLEMWVYIASFAYSFWKARNKPQGIDLPKAT